MKATGIVALSLLGFAAAAPYNFQKHGKRDLVWVTETAEVVETVVQTTTVWVDPTEEAQEYTPTSTPTSTPTPEPTTETPVYTPTPTPEPTSTEAPATTEEPSTSSTSSSSVYTPPAPTTTETPTSTYTPAPTTEAPSSTSTYVAPVPSSTSSETSSSAAPAASSAVVAAESSSSETFTPSRITYYSPSVGLGSCGQVYSDDSNVVALAAGNMKSDLCNKKLTIEVNGKTFGAFIGDTCPGCPSDGSLDITPTLFTKMMGSTDAGVITDAKWWWD